MAEDLKSKPKEFWQGKLDENQFCIAREGQTEAPFTGKYWDTKTAGTYECACCGEDLFASTAKYDSGSGWPSFYEPVGGVKDERIEEKEDLSHGMRRTEIVCHKCGAHLGHVFSDGPKPTGLRYCVNSASLNLRKS